MYYIPPVGFSVIGLSPQSYNIFQVESEIKKADAAAYINPELADAEKLKGNDWSVIVFSIMLSCDWSVIIFALLLSCDWPVLILALLVSCDWSVLLFAILVPCDWSDIVFALLLSSD